MTPRGVCCGVARINLISIPYAPGPHLRAREAVEQPVAPILRWVGGKQYLREALIAAVPTDACRGTYFEPFLGAASLFLLLRPNRAILGDANPHLMSTYRLVRGNPIRVSRALNLLAAADCEEHYYDVRERYNRSAESAVRAARFIYLNRTCFNGVFRVNQRGRFNVPYGHKAKPVIPDRLHLTRFACAMKAARLVAGDFEETLDSVTSGDFVYLDPPYPALNGTSYFAHYTTNRFGEAHQTKLAAITRELDRRGARILISNADTSLIRRLYRSFRFSDLSVTRYVTSSAVKHRVKELLISNYDPPKVLRSPPTSRLPNG